MKKFVMLILLSCLILGSVTGCSTAASQSARETTVRIGTQPWIGYGPWWIAQEKGLFEKYGLKVELVDFAEDKEVNAAFASGDMQAANLAAHTAIKLYTAGLDLSVVLLEDVSTSADAILADNSITSIADLKGKSVAYEEGTTSDLLLNYALSQNGMTLADITPVPMPASDAGTALLTGNVPAAVTYEPYISEVTKENTKVSVLYKAGERPGLISDVLVVNSTWAAANPEIVSKLLQVWNEALTYYNENPDDAQAIIAKAVGSEPADLVTAFDGVQFYSADENKKALTGDFASTIKDVAAVSQSIGLIDKIPDLSKLVDAGYLK
jgi:NitT/TauT family transport system substrate-binding protein